MTNYIQNMATESVTSDLVNDINQIILAFEPFKINLVESEKEGSRSMAEGREGYSRLVSRIANQHPNGLSRSDDPAELTKILNYNDRLLAVRFAILSILEQIEETQLGAAIDIMKLVDRYVKSLQISRNDDASIDLAMREVDEWNKRFASNKNKSETPSADSPTE